VIESRTGKYAVVGVLLILAVVLATSRPKKPRIVYPVAATLAAVATVLAWRVTLARPLERRFPLGDPQSFIDTVPNHIQHLREWTQERGIASPPLYQPDIDEWLWSQREALGQEWGRLLHGLVAAYGEALRVTDPSRVWSVRGGEPVVVAPGSFPSATRVFNEVHDAVFADA
jgi:hypothetical protein